MKRLSLWPPRGNTLSGELTLVYASLCLALVVLLSWIAYQKNAHVLEEGIRLEMLRSVDQTVQEINSEIQERVAQVQMLTLVPALKEVAAQSTRRTEALGLQRASEAEVESALRRPGPKVDASSAGRFLEELKENNPSIGAVSVTDRYGIPAASTLPASPVREDRSTWWQECVTQKFYLSNLEFNRTAGGHTYSIALPMNDDPRSPIGVVKVTFDLRALQELMERVRIGRNGRMVLLSREGTVLSHPDHQFLYRQAADVPALSPIASIITSQLRGVKDFSYRDAAGDSSERWLAGYSRVMRSASLGPLNWTVVALVSRSEVISPIISVRNSAVIAGLLFILAAIPIVFAVSRRMSEPLVDLASRADRISTGDFEVSLALPSSHENEIGRLATALATMVENLKATNRRTMDINAGLERTVRERTEELQRKNRQIEAQNKKVMDASRLKSQFLANMSHELRTPLNAVLALSEILSNEMSGPLNEEQGKQVSIINRSGRSLLRLINDVLDLSKIEAGRMNVEKAPMSLHSLITLITDTLRPLAEDKGLSLSAGMAQGLPEFIQGDEHKLRQILINLVGNAIKFTERGSVKLQVGFTSKPKLISFAIVDTGIGIALDAADRIFEEFCQADGSTTRKYGGTGLGLTISKKMAELMGGTLSVASAPATGSTFTLSVPWSPAPPVPATEAETLRRVRMQVPEPALMNNGDDSASALHDPRPIVLVAEDEPDTLYIMKKYLNRLGCQAVFARDGNDVLEKAKTFRPIAITLDLVLPKKNGWDVLSELKTDPETRHIPVIIASVLDNQERGFCLGAYRYLVKPVNETELADTIIQILAAQRKGMKRVLVIDDNVVDSDLIARLLTENKYDVLRAARGEEGIATAARECPDLILLDLNMPEMDGFAVMEGLKRRPETRTIPIVICTARDLTEQEQARLRRDAQRIFLKNPLEPTRLLAEIGELLKSVPPRGSLEGTVSDGATPGATSPVAAVSDSGQNMNPDTRQEEEGSAGDVFAPTAGTAQGRRGESPQSLHSAPAHNASGRILLVEDDSANQYTLEFLLKSEGYEVIVAENGREAIRKAEELLPDIILMDMMMPVMGGHEATKVLKETPGVLDIPIIALTAAAMTGDREKALAAGCDDYVSKPVNQSVLLERTACWMQRAHEMQRGPRASGSTAVETAAAGGGANLAADREPEET